MTYDSSEVGFTIPEYQRPYDWGEPNIERLYHDILDGVQRFSEEGGADASTFLGTLILIEEEAGVSSENFSGTSFAVVDGQQRLTTLALLACALCEEVGFQFHKIDFSSTDTKIEDWLKEETLACLDNLRSCAVGWQGSFTTFPRIVRPGAGDKRDQSEREAEYKSPVGNFLNKFQQHFSCFKRQYRRVE